MERPYATLYLLTIEMFDQSVTVYEIFTIQMFMTLTLIFRIGQGKCKYANWQVICNFLVCNSHVFPICHRLLDNQYELPKILDLNIWPWKWSRTLAIWTKIGMWTCLINMHMYAKIGTSRASLLSTVHNHIFCDKHTNWRTDWRVDVLPAKITSFNSVESM